MSKLFAWLENLLDGKKTVIVAVVVAGIGIAKALGYDTPEWLLTLLAGLGLYSVKKHIDSAE